MKKTIKERFGDSIREKRQELHLSQEKLAEHTGLHRTYISSVELGHRNISIENIEKLAIALNSTPSDLLK